MTTLADSLFLGESRNRRKVACSVERQNTSLQMKSARPHFEGRHSGREVLFTHDYPATDNSNTKNLSPCNLQQVSNNTSSPSPEKSLINSKSGHQASHPELRTLIDADRTAEPAVYHPVPYRHSLISPVPPWIDPPAFRSGNGQNCQNMRDRFLVSFGRLRSVSPKVLSL